MERADANTFLRSPLQLMKTRREPSGCGGLASSAVTGHSAGLLPFTMQDSAVQVNWKLHVGGLFTAALLNDCRDPPKGVLEIHRVLLNADEAFAREDGGDAGGSAAHERIEDGVGLDGVAEVLHLRQGTRARHGIAAGVAVPGPQVVYMPVSRQVVAQERIAAPEDDGIPA